MKFQSLIQVRGSVCDSDEEIEFLLTVFVFLNFIELHVVAIKDVLTFTLP